MQDDGKMIFMFQWFYSTRIHLKKKFMMAFCIYDSCNGAYKRNIFFCKRTSLLLIHLWWSLFKVFKYCCIFKQQVVSFSRSSRIVDDLMDSNFLDCFDEVSYCSTMKPFCNTHKEELIQKCRKTCNFCRKYFAF